MEQEGTQEPARFDPRIAEPPAVPTLIPVLRPAGAEDAAAAGDLALDPEAVSYTHLTLPTIYSV